MLKILLGVVIATLIGVVAFAFVPKIANANQTPTQIVEDANKLTISITGEVVKPGNYILEEGSTLQDLLDKAGGANNNADSRAYYLDLEVIANEEYYIPPKYDNSNICSNDPIEKVNINTASKEELMTISGFGEALSTSVISYREENGTFYTLEDVMNVDGIGNAKFNTCKNYIILDD